MTHDNLLAGPPPTLLPDDLVARAEAEAGAEPSVVAAHHPTYLAAWADLADTALKADDPVTAYAFARTGYHRGLDALRRAGWKGHGPVPWAHEPNRGWLRSLAALGRAASLIGENDEAERCAAFLRDSSAEAADALGL